MPVGVLMGWLRGALGQLTGITPCADAYGRGSGQRAVDAGDDALEVQAPRAARRPALRNRVVFSRSPECDLVRRATTARRCGHPPIRRRATKRERRNGVRAVGRAFPLHGLIAARQAWW